MQLFLKNISLTMDKKKGNFIVFEGIDGSGKSTQVQLLAQQLKEQGHRVEVTCEPTYSRIGQIIRDVFTRKMNADTRTIAGLFVADRLHHLLNEEDGIVRQLNQGITVISDRYYFSSYAYQGAHVSMDWVINANAQSAAILRPDINIFVDIEPKISMERIQKGRDQTELYENEANLQLVRDAYFTAFEKEKDHENIFITPGHLPPADVAHNIWQKVKQLY